MHSHSRPPEEAARLSYHLRSHPPNYRKPAGEFNPSRGLPMAHTAAERVSELPRPPRRHPTGG